MFLLSPPPINFLSHLRLQLQQPRDLQHQILQKRCLSLPRLSIGFSWFQSVFVISELCLVRILPFFVAIDALFIRRPSGTVVLYLGTLRRLLLCQRSTSIHAWTPKSVLLFHYFSPAFLICFILQKWPPAFHINFSVFLFHLSVSLWVARLHSCSLVPSFLDLYCQILFFLSLIIVLSRHLWRLLFFLLLAYDFDYYHINAVDSTAQHHDYQFYIYTRSPLLMPWNYITH